MRVSQTSSRYADGIAAKHAAEKPIYLAIPFTVNGMTKG
jgi:hypothetical protein